MQFYNVKTRHKVDVPDRDVSVGYEIYLALQRNKPVIILHSVGDPPSLIGEHMNEKLVCEKHSPATLSDIIDDFINYIKFIQDSFVLP